jgi:hypothetical protein
MIEFKGAFYKNKTSPPQLVLVQFDEVLLHVWNISYPFHRILSSDDFSIPVNPIHRRLYVRLPRGGRIETDDAKALALLKSSHHPGSAARFPQRIKRQRVAFIFSALAAVLTMGIFVCWLSTG